VLDVILKSSFGSLLILLVQICSKRNILSVKPLFNMSTRDTSITYDEMRQRAIKLNFGAWDPSEIHEKTAPNLQNC